MLRLAVQGIEKADDDAEAAEEDVRVERLAVELPADEGDQRDAHEVQRHDHRGIALTVGVGQAVMGEQAAEADADEGHDMRRLEPEARTPGSRPQRFMGSCSRFMKNRIEKVLSVIVRRLVMMATRAKLKATPSIEETGRLQGFHARAEDDENADETEDDGHETPASSSSP